MAVRTFVALELPAALVEGILALIAQMRDRGIRASWSGRGTLHVTLKFLGDVEEHELPSVVEAVAAAAARVRPFSFDTERLGAFPSPRNPRVLWVGVTPVDELFELQEGIESELAALGFARERRRFHPHITLGRVRDRAPDDIAGVLSALSAPRAEVAATEVRVMRSTLDPGGAIHDVVEAVPLGGDRKGT